MSKAVRIRDHLYAEIEALAKTERRSLISQLEVLLEQALQLPENFDKPKIGPATNEPRVQIEATVVADAQSRDVSARTLPDPDVKPDFK